MGGAEKILRNIIKRCSISSSDNQLLASKSAIVYNGIWYNGKTITGFLILTNRRRLCDYKNYIRSKRKFNNEIIYELLKKVSNFSDYENFFVLLMDEMKIQDNRRKHTDELFGYVNLDDIEWNYATLKKTDDIATHILVFFTL